MSLSALPGGIFTADEKSYLDAQVLGRLVTVDRIGRPQVRPVGFVASAQAIEIGGRDLARTQKFQNIKRNPEVAFIVDDLTSVEPWFVRGIEIRGTAEALNGSRGPLVRILPRRILTWGLDGDLAVRARDA